MQLETKYKMFVHSSSDASALRGNILETLGTNCNVWGFVTFASRNGKHSHCEQAKAFKQFSDTHQVLSCGYAQQRTAIGMDSKGICQALQSMRQPAVQLTASQMFILPLSLDLHSSNHKLSTASTQVCCIYCAAHKCTLCALTTTRQCHSSTACMCTHN